VDLLVGQENAGIAYDVVRQVGAVVHGASVPDIAGYDPRSCDARGGAQVVVLQDPPLDGTHADKPGELVVADQVRIEGVADADEGPVGAGIPLSDQRFRLFGAEGAIGCRIFFELRVADVVFVGPRGQEPIGDESESVFRVVSDGDVVHWVQCTANWRR
jgi:hypothetical protein